MNLSKRIDFMDELHTIIHSNVKNGRERSRNAREKGELAYFIEGDYVLVARQDFYKGEKLCLRWHEPWLIVKDLKDYVFTVEDIRSCDYDDVQGTKLKL